MGTRAAAGRRAFPFLLLLLGVGPATASAMDVLPDSIGGVGAEGLPISRIEVVARNIFDPLPPGRLRPVYRLANALHVRTRQRTVRDYMLLKPGDVFTEERARETERLLRGLDILDPQRLMARRVGDSVVVVVETRDAWSTSPEFNVESGGGKAYGAVSLVERNLFGLGKSLSLSYREDPSGISRSAAFRDPNLAGSRIRLEVEGGTGSEGANQRVSVGVPFYAQDTPNAYGFRWSRVTSVAKLYEGNRETANFDRRVEDTELFWGRGRRVGEAIVRVTGSFQTKDRRFGPSRADSTAPPEFRGGEENLDLRRVALEVHLWRPQFVEKIGIERLGGVEDFDLGQSLKLMTGFSPKFLGSTFDEGYVRGQLEVAAQPAAALFGWIHLDVQSRIRDEPLETIARAEGRAYVQEGSFQTSLLATEGIVGKQVVRDFQIVHGGLNGLRAFPVHAIAGQQAWRFNAEHRWLLVRDWYQLFSLGAAAFYDGGRTWGPGAVDRAWHHDAGIGLRVSLPRSGLNRVARIDVAWPIRPVEGGREPVLSFGSSQAF